MVPARRPAWDDTEFLLLSVTPSTATPPIATPPIATPPIATEVAAVPRGSRARVLAGFAAFGLFWGAWGAVLPAVQASAGVDDGQLGTALLMVGLGALLSMRLAGSLLDRAGRPVIVAALGLFAVAGFLPAFAAGPGTLMLMLSMLVLGVASGATDVCVNAAAVDYETAGSRRIVNTAHAAFSIAVVTSGVGIAGLRATGRPVWELLGVTQTAVLAIAVAIGTGREPWRPRSRPRPRSGPAVPTPPGPAAQRVRDVRGVRGVPRVLVLLGSIGAVAYLLENAWQSWSAILLQADRGAGPGISSAAPAVFAGAAAAGRLFGDRLSHRLAPGPLLAGGATVAAAGSVLAAQAPGAAVTLVGVAVAGLGTSVCAPTVVALAGGSETRLGRAAAVSVVTSLSYLGFLVGPPFVGLVSSFTTLPLAMTVVAVLAAGLAAVAAAGWGIPNRIGAGSASQSVPLPVIVDYQFLPTHEACSHHVRGAELAGSSS